MTSEARMRSVGIIGLGIMGKAYAANLVASGFDVCGYDVDKEAVAALVAGGGRGCSDITELTGAADVILVALASEAALASVTDALVAKARPDTIAVEMGTLSATAKERSRAQLSAVGVTMLDCPVSGTGAQAAHGDLVVFASGAHDAYERVKPVLQAIARDVRHVGSFGAGMKLKLVANLLVAVHNLATAEALLLAGRSGLDPETTLDALRSGAAGSRMLDLRGPLMVSGTYEPATMKMDVFMKDLALIAEQARDVGAPVPLFSASLPFYTAALSEGRDEQDTAAVFEALRAMTGVGT